MQQCLRRCAIHAQEAQAVASFIEFVCSISLFVAAVIVNV